jgi:hypothetical protein
MNDSTEHPRHETSLHDALHAHVRESGADAAGPYLAGLADGALQVARRRQRMARAGLGVATAAVVAAAWVGLAHGPSHNAHVVQPAASGTGNTEKAAVIDILPVVSSTEHACARGSGGYTVHASADHPALCIRADRARGMTGVHAVSAKAVKGPVDGTGQVDVTLSAADRTRYAALTGSIATATAPRNGLAFVIDGKLWGNPYVNRSITVGRLEIVGAFAGDLTSATAHDLALRLDPGR